MARATLASRSLGQGKVAFQTEGRLLQELGERLVASPEVALVELIKNAYDADSKTCDVRLADDGRSLEILDDGHGMTFEEFSARWMRIATSHKLDERTSPIFGRRRTGQKGIGRFAVRFLGAQLKLTSVAWDPKRKTKTRLEADFDWAEIDTAKNLQTAVVPYRLLEASDDATSGTTLRIEELKRDPNFISSKYFRTSVLKIVSPLESLDRGHFKRSETASKDDPGFRVALPGDAEGGEPEDLATEILGRAWATLKIDLRGDALKYQVTLGDAKKRTLKIRSKSNISSGLYGDIRFFPRRSGVFSGASFDGREAWTWVRENCGVAVVDHGFRVKPFGFSEDDWLSLDLDAAHNRRDWRSTIAATNFPIADALRTRPADNPALNLPNNFQLVGAVFVESAPPALSSQLDDLTPSMDREGYLENDAYWKFVDVVRGGIEFLALEDKRYLLERQEARAREAAKQTRSDFKAAIQWIEESETLTRGDKARLVEHYSGMAHKLQEVEEYDREARRKLETMSLLGVVAGFMTHEAARIMDGLERAIARVRALAREDSSLTPLLKQIETGYTAFKGHVDYTSAFVESLHKTESPTFKSAPQVRRVIERFGQFAIDRNIKVANEVPNDVMAPAVPIALYSGVLLNLYTNALKAVIAAEKRSDPPQIVFRSWNEGTRHIIEVLDKGLGIPPEMRQRVFDPLFTTTSNLNNPLGSGMGLGLSLIRELMRHVGGAVRIVEPPAGYSTCFRVELPSG